MPYLDAATMAAIEADLIAAHQSLAHGETRIAPPAPPVNGVYAGLVRPPVPPMDPATRGLIGKVAHDLGAVVVVGLQILREVHREAVEHAEVARAPVVVSPDVIDAEWEEVET
jgi:hypothetical protein